MFRYFAGCAYFFSDEFIERLIDVGGLWQTQLTFVFVTIFLFATIIAYCEWDLRRLQNRR